MEGEKPSTTVAFETMTFCLREGFVSNRVDRPNRGRYLHFEVLGVSCLKSLLTTGYSHRKNQRLLEVLSSPLSIDLSYALSWLLQVRVIKSTISNQAALHGSPFNKLLNHLDVCDKDFIFKNASKFRPLVDFHQTTLPILLK